MSPVTISGPVPLNSKPFECVTIQMSIHLMLLLVFLRI